MTLKGLNYLAILSVIGGAIIVPPNVYSGEFNCEKSQISENRPLERKENSGLEDRVDEKRLFDVRKNISRKYIDIYLVEGKGKIDSIDKLLKNNGVVKTRNLFYNIEEIPFKVIKKEINCKEGVSQMVNLYNKIDDRMNWDSKYITCKFKDIIEYKVKLFKHKMDDGKNFLNRKEVSELIHLSDGVLGGVKKEVLTNNKKYTRFIPFIGDFIISIIVDNNINSSKRVVKKVYEEMLKRE